MSRLAGGTGARKCSRGVVSYSRQVKTDEGRSVAQKLGATFIETSAKDNKNVRECQISNYLALAWPKRAC